MPFGGNPNVTITAINVSGGIATSRTSGQTPCFVQVSASAITATGTSIPYEDLEYAWDFGDPSGTETFSQPLISSLLKFAPNTVNANSAQTGPEAAYCYRSSGTYTVTLTIRGQNGASFTTAQTTQNITVTTFSASGGTFYFDSVNGNDSWDGLAPVFTSGSNGPKQSISAIQTAFATNRSLNLARGSNWTGTGTLNISSGASPLRVDAYGSGSKPIIGINSSATFAALRLGNGAGGGSPDDKADLVFSNINWQSAATADTQGVVNGTSSNATGSVSNAYFDNCAWTVTGNQTGGISLVIQGPKTAPLFNWGVWNCTFVGPLVADLGNRQTIFVDISGSWMFFFGLSIAAAGSSVILDHHIYPNVLSHMLARYITFGSGAGKNYCINTNWNTSGGLEFSEFICFSDNDFTGPLRALDAGNVTNDPTMSLFRNFVVQRNAIHDMEGDGVVLFSCGQTMTWRDNLWWGLSHNTMLTPGSATTISGNFYRNRVYRLVVSPNPGHGAGIISFSSNSFASFTQKQTITDNIIQDQRAVGNVLEGITSGLQGSSSIINRNQYYVPNDADAKFIYDSPTAITFAAWQADGFDANSTIANPNWNAPTSGDFTPQGPPPTFSMCYI